MYIHIYVHTYTYPINNLSVYYSVCLHSCMMKNASAWLSRLKLLWQEGRLATRLPDCNAGASQLPVSIIIMINIIRFSIIASNHATITIPNNASIIIHNTSTARLPGGRWQRYWLLNRLLVLWIHGLSACRTSCLSASCMALVSVRATGRWLRSPQADCLCNRSASSIRKCCGIVCVCIRLKSVCVPVGACVSV